MCGFSSLSLCVYAYIHTSIYLSISPPIHLYIYIDIDRDLHVDGNKHDYVNINFKRRLVFPVWPTSGSIEPNFWRIWCLFVSTTDSRVVLLKVHVGIQLQIPRYEQGIDKSSTQKATNVHTGSSSNPAISGIGDAGVRKVSPGSTSWCWLSVPAGGAMSV